MENTMTISKALKEKNKILGEMSQLKERIQSYNSVEKGQSENKDYSSVEMIGRLYAKMDEIVALKTAIHRASDKVRPLIFRLSELKTMTNFLRGISTLTGKSTRGFREESLEYVAEITTKQMDVRLEDIMKEIEQIQDALDAFNVTTHCPP